MRVDELGRVGVALTSDGDIYPLVAYKDNRGCFSVYRSNDVFGMQVLMGFEEFELQVIDDSMIDDLIDILSDPEFEGTLGVIKIEDGFIFIKDFDCGECGYIKGALIADNYENIESDIICGEFEDTSECEYYGRLMEFFE